MIEDFKNELMSSVQPFVIVNINKGRQKREPQSDSPSAVLKHTPHSMYILYNK